MFWKGEFKMNKEYVNAEDIVDVNLSQYNEDMIAFETARMFNLLPREVDKEKLGVQEMRMYEDATKKIIQGRLSYLL